MDNYSNHMHSHLTPQKIFLPEHSGTLFCNIRSTEPIVVLIKVNVVSNCILFEVCVMQINRNAQTQTCFSLYAGNLNGTVDLKDQGLVL